MEIATNSLLVADWSQTRQFPDNNIEEKNIILGKYPSKEHINYYFAGCLLTNTILHRTLPDKYLDYYQKGLIIVQVGAISNNYSLGVRVKF